ncbi:MAG: sensor histidine kinase [Gemmatimonadales bacterium]
MSGPIASSRGRDRRLRRLAPAVVLLLVALLTGLSIGSSWLVARHFRAEAVTASRLYAVAFRGLGDPDPGAANTALLDVGDRVRSLGLPLVLTDTAGRVTATANAPPMAGADSVASVRRYVDQLDRVNPPIAIPAIGALHYGAIPQTRLLTALGVLQAITILIMVAVAAVAYRNATTAQRDRMWVAMAREAAHQMGTPLTSLQGWIEQLRGAELSPHKVAEFLDADAERLHRVAQRFERIGNPARRDPVPLGALAERVAGYYRPRLPRHANAIQLDVRAASSGPVIQGDPILLEWALEVMVKNAIDALQGRGGRITLAVDADPAAAVVRVIDDGPGIPREIRRTIFEPGVTTKRGGWGIGLALARRVVEDAHQGVLALEPTAHGTTFVMRLPLTATA